MKLFNLIKRFNKDEDGAVTVDWVVLTAAVVGLGLIVIGAIEGSVTDLSENIAGSIDAAQN
ncbi:MAG: hypothetical protein IAE87_15260 [Rhodobacteraceae bacterium]|jgi:Flp pilus assembly pilin Flp|nr:hypothetical protein [Paracoccaceae bacterium]